MKYLRRINNRAHSAYFVGANPLRASASGERRAHRARKSPGELMSSSMALSRRNAGASCGERRSLSRANRPGSAAAIEKSWRGGEPDIMSA